MGKRSKYKRVRVAGKNKKEHRIIWEGINGPVPEGYELHHINEDPRDNRIENLQLLTRNEHMKVHGMSVVEYGTKVCRACSIQKSVAEFKMHKGYPYFRCKKCDNLIEKIRRMSTKAVKSLTSIQSP